MKVMRGENKVDLPLTLDDLKDQPQMPRPASQNRTGSAASTGNPASRELPPGFPPGSAGA